MKFLIAVILLISANAFAVNQYGDLVTGSANSPTAGTVIVDTGSLTAIGSNHDFYDVTFVAACSLACNVEVGIYSSSDVAVATYTELVLGGTTAPVRLPHIPIVNNQKLKIKAGTLNLGTISGAIALQLMNSA